MVPQLPPELLSRIVDFSALKGLEPTMYLTLCLTSRTFLALARRALYRHLTLYSILDETAIDGTLQAHPQLASLVETVEFVINGDTEDSDPYMTHDICGNVQALMLQRLATLCPNIRSFGACFHCCPSLEQAGVLGVALAQALPNLRELDMPLVREVQAILPRLPNLVKLTAGPHPELEVEIEADALLLERTEAEQPSFVYPFQLDSFSENTFDASVSPLLFKALASQSFSSLLHLSLTSRTIVQVDLSSYTSALASVTFLHVLILEPDERVPEQSQSSEVAEAISRFSGLRLLRLEQITCPSRAQPEGRVRSLFLHGFLNFAPYLRHLPRALEAVRLDSGQSALDSHFEEVLDNLRTSTISRIQVTKSVGSLWPDELERWENLQGNESWELKKEQAKPIWEKFGWEAFEGAGVIDLVRSV